MKTLKLNKQCRTVIFVAQKSEGEKEREKRKIRTTKLTCVVAYKDQGSRYKSRAERPE
jgi:hypothetical protein